MSPPPKKKKNGKEVHEKDKKQINYCMGEGNGNYDNALVGGKGKESEIEI